MKLLHSNPVNARNLGRRATNPHGTWLALLRGSSGKQKELLLSAWHVQFVTVQACHLHPYGDAMRGPRTSILCSSSPPKKEIRHQHNKLMLSCVLLGIHIFCCQDHGSLYGRMQHGTRYNGSENGTLALTTVYACEPWSKLLVGSTP